MRRICLFIPVLAMLAWAPTAGASSRQTVTFEAPRELLSASTRDATLDQIKSFGVTRVRQLVYWRDYAPKPDSRHKPKDFTYPADKWDNLDGLMAAARARGMSVMLTLTGPPPRWAQNRKKGPNAKEFGAFAATIAQRYADTVNTWSIWNEPNQPQFLKPQYRKGKPASPRIYRKLYQAAYKGIRASNPRDTILIAETSPRGNSHVVAPLAFLRGMLCLNSRYHKAKHCAALPADGYAHHAYTTSAGPRWKPPKRDDVTIGVLPRLVRALNRAAKAHALPAHLPIYLTEFGIQTKPDAISGVSLSKQAEYLAVAEHIAYVNPRVAAFSQYLMSDDPPRSHGYRYGGFESGLRSASGKAKPAYKGFPLPLAVEAYGASDVIWGLVRPERAQTQVTIERRPRGAKRWHKLRTLTTTSTGVYALKTKHKRGQRYRVRWGTLTGASVRAY